MITLSPDNFKKELKKQNWVLLDVRTPEELTTYWVISEDQVHINMSTYEAPKKIAALAKDKSYFIYCWHGVRSKQVWFYMKSLWFKNIYDLEGGIDNYYLN